MQNELPVVVRPSRDSDVEPMLAIYRRHIRRGIEEGVEDTDTPQPDDLRDRRKNLRNRRFPHLVATRGGEVVGYAYVVLFRKRPAYRYTVKHSIYVHHEHLGHGIGRQHQAVAHPQVEGVPEIRFRYLTIGLQPAEQGGTFPAFGIHPGVHPGGEAAGQVFR